jgi:hypothetical protein
MHPENTVGIRFLPRVRYFHARFLVLKVLEIAFNLKRHGLFDKTKLRGRAVTKAFQETILLSRESGIGFIEYAPQNIAKALIVEERTFKI